MADELKPCPFCGATDPVKLYDWVKCRTCSAQTNGLIWNTRPIEDALRAEVKELRGLLSVLLDVIAVPGHVVTSDEWERICLLSGRYCEPYLTARIDGPYDIIALRAEVAKYRGMEVENAGLRTDNDGLRAEVARLKVAEGEAMLVVESQDASIAALKDELAKRSAPLTNDQARMVALMRGESSPAISFYQGVDVAIRAAREGVR